MTLEEEIVAALNVAMPTNEDPMGQRPMDQASRVSNLMCVIDRHVTKARAEREPTGEPLAKAIGDLQTAIMRVVTEPGITADTSALRLCDKIVNQIASLLEKRQAAMTLAVSSLSPGSHWDTLDQRARKIEAYLVGA